MKKDDIRYGAERYTDKLWETTDEAVEDHIDNCIEEGLEGDLTVLEFKRATIPEPTKGEAESLLDSLWDDLNDEYGDPDYIEQNEPSETIKNEAIEFLKKVYADYVPWAMEPTGKEIQVNLKKWAEEN